MNLNVGEASFLGEKIDPIGFSDLGVGWKKLQWWAGEKYSELGIHPNDIVNRMEIPYGFKVQCIDGRFQPEDGATYLRIPGGAIGLAADVYTALTQIWKEDYLQRHEDELIFELADFFGGKITGHTDENACETGFCGCGHLKQTVYTECKRADDMLRNFLLNISTDRGVFDQHVMGGDHYEKKVIHAGKFDVSSNINGVQAFVYHGEYHQAMMEAISQRLARWILAIESRDVAPENATHEMADLQSRILETIREIAEDRRDTTVERLANGFEHIFLEGPAEVRETRAENREYKTEMV